MKAPLRREEVRETLEARGLGALHRFGQNFLVRREAHERIVAAAAIAPGAPVLEVGPGLGALTEHLLDAGARVVAVEIDRGLAAFLEELFADRPAFRLVVGDVMARKSAIAPEVLATLEAVGAFDPPGGWKVVANLPYGISSPFLVALAALPCPPERTVVTIQREVGDALLAGPGDAAYTPLSFVARTWYRAQRVMGLGPDDFHPRPKVHSAVMALDRVAQPEAPAARVLPFVRRLFQGRRKALGGTTARAFAGAGGAPPAAEAVRAALQAAGIEARARIDGTDPARIVALWRALEAGARCS